MINRSTFDAAGRRRALAAGTAIWLVAAAAPALAEGLRPATPAETGATQTAQAADRVEVSIPAQPLNDALLTFSEQTGVDVFFDAQALTGLRSQAVSGTFAPREALERMIGDSGVTYSLIGDAVTLQGPIDAAAAGEEQLGPVVVSATRTATPISELTRSVTVIDREEIEQQKRIDRSVGDMLGKSVPGFSPSTEALTDFGQTLRGRNFLTLIDGMPQSTPLRDGRRSLNTIDADAIERIEVVRGGTAAYGFGATGGLVNIITRRPEDGEINGHSEGGIKFSTTHPEDSVEWHTNHRVSGRVDQYDYVFSGTFVDRDGYFDAEGDRIPSDPFGVQGGLAETEEYNILAKGGYEVDDGDQRVELSVNRFFIEQDPEFGLTINGDPQNRIKTRAARGTQNLENPGTENTTVNLEYRHADVAGSTLNLQTYYGDLMTRYSKFPGFDQAQIESQKIGARATVDTPVNLPSYGFDVTWGLDYLHDETSQPLIQAVDTTPDMSQDAVAGFAQVEAPVGDVALLRGGVRHERITVDVSDVQNNSQNVFVRGGELQFNETLFNASGVVYMGDHAEVFGGYSQGFSLADIGRAISNTTQTDATQLESEAQTVDNYEIGVRGMGDRWDASLAGFYSESDNGTTFNSSLQIQKQPERIWGLEASANFDATEEIRVGGTAAWLEGEIDRNDDGDYEEELPSTRIPPLKITAFVEADVTEWLTGRFQGMYSGNRTPNSSLFGGGKVRNYTLFDLYATADTGYGELALGVDNLFNEDYFTVLSQAGAQNYGFSKGPGRTASITYSIKW